PRTAGDDLADDLVAEDQRQLRIRQLAVGDVQVGPADPAGAHAQQHLARARLGIRQLAQDQRPARLLEQHRLHRLMARQRRARKSSDPKSKSSIGQSMRKPSTAPSAPSENRTSAKGRNGSGKSTRNTSWCQWLIAPDSVAGLAATSSRSPA